MDLKIGKISFSDFRNYERYVLEGVGPLTIFVGPNGVGKTNILEGINLLTAGETFRHAQISQLVREGKEQARLEIDSTDGNRSLKTSLLLEAGKKRYQVNGKAKSLSDLKGVLPSVSFTPDDLDLAKKSSSVKRDALDALGMQLSKNYYIVHRDYEKTVRYKNRLLKEEASRILIESVNDTLLLCGSQLFCYRVSLFDRMIPIMSGRYDDISHSGERFGASYVPSWDDRPLEDGVPARETVRKRLEEALSSTMEEERVRGRSLVGPHADKLSFTLDGRDVASYASQGQQRSIVLAWKLAEVETVKKSLGTAPVLLLDDVMSELDETRRDKLVKLVTDDTQTFMTATDLTGFNEELLGKAQVIRL